MPTVTFELGGLSTVGKIACEAQGVRGDGGTAYPRLIIPVDLTIKPVLSPRIGGAGETARTVQPFPLLQINGKLALTEGPRVAEMVPQILEHQSYESETGNERTHHLEFPLDAHRLTAIEETRRGGPLGLQLTMNLLAALHLGRQPGPPHPVPGPVLAFYTGTTVLRLTIPQSQWATNILPKLGYGERIVMELPLSTPIGRDSLRGTLEHLQSAWTAFRQGNDPEVLRLCYLLWERLVQDFDAGAQPDQNAFSKLLERISVEPEKREKLQHLFRYLADFNHLARHEQKPPVPVDHRDAEFALLAAQTVLLYLAKLM
jgi:hypothetical protein